MYLNIATLPLLQLYLSTRDSFKHRGNINIHRQQAADCHLLIIFDIPDQPSGQLQFSFDWAKELIINPHKNLLVQNASFITLLKSTADELLSNYTIFAKDYMIYLCILLGMRRFEEARIHLFLLVRKFSLDCPYQKVKYSQNCC